MKFASKSIANTSRTAPVASIKRNIVDRTREITQLLGRFCENPPFHRIVYVSYGILSTVLLYDHEPAEEHRMKSSDDERSVCGAAISAYAEREDTTLLIRYGVIKSVKHAGK